MLKLADDDNDAGAQETADDDNDAGHEDSQIQQALLESMTAAQSDEDKLHRAIVASNNAQLDYPRPDAEEEELQIAIALSDQDKLQRAIIAPIDAQFDHQREAAEVQAAISLSLLDSCCGDPHLADLFPGDNSA